MITPVDLETMVFRRGFRGYNVNEVQDFMVRITHDYERLYRENIELKEKIEELTAQINQYQLMEDTLRNAMILAQETAEEVKNTAKGQAEMILREAEQRSDRIKGRIKDEIQGEIQKLATLKNQVEFFKCQFKSFLNGLLDIAENQMELKLELNDAQVNKIIHEYAPKATPDPVISKPETPKTETAATHENETLIRMDQHLAQQNS